MVTSKFSKNKFKPNHKIDTLKLMTCGSVDDGKSTLIGRILYDSKSLYLDQLEELKITNKYHKTDFDFSSLVDGLEAEKEQKITIDVAYRYFSTLNRRFILLDTPGHEQYTRNMITAASNADLAIILINAKVGLTEQTNRHAVICSVLGIKNIILAINKMDLVNFDQNYFSKINDSFDKFGKSLIFSEIKSIPISALKGDNIVMPSKNMKWYNGPTLIEYIENIKINKTQETKLMRFPIQYTNIYGSNNRGFLGKVSSGEVNIDQKIIILPSEINAKINKIFLYKENMKTAKSGQSITITLDKDVDASRGDIIVDIGSKYNLSDQFQVKVFWFSNNHGFVGRVYLMKIGTTTVNVQITSIKYKIDINNLNQLSAKSLKKNDIAVVNLKINKVICYETFAKCKELGSFIFIDKETNETIGAGIINLSLRRSGNILYQELKVNKKSRQNLNGHLSKVFWLTGLSGSGKTTIANALEYKFYKLGIKTYVLDGDNVRLGINKDLGFTNEDRIENIRRIGEVSKLMVDAGLVVIVASISPFRTERKMVKELFSVNEFIEIFVDCSLETAERRDPKGLYKKARLGQIKNFTGIDSEYEIPINPDIHLDTNKNNIKSLVQKIISYSKLNIS